MNGTSVGWVSHLVLWAVVVCQVALTLALARLVGQLSRRTPPSGARIIDPGPEIGAVLGGWDATDLRGHPATVRFPRDRGLFLLYVSPHCGVCARLLPAAKRFFREIAGEADGVWVMTTGSRAAQQAYAERHGLTGHAAVAEDELPPALRLRGGPFAVWIDAAGRVRVKGMVNHREHLESLRTAVTTGYTSLDSYLTARAEAEERQRERALESP
jgi:methylamine dehydrogenase accessory protein MauD